MHGKMRLNKPGKGSTKVYWLFDNPPLNTSSYYHKIFCIDGQWVYITVMKVLYSEVKSNLSMLYPPGAWPWIMQIRYHRIGKIKSRNRELNEGQ